MKRTTFFMLWGLALLTLLILPVLPHHHHKRLCVVVDACMPFAPSEDAPSPNTASHEHDGGVSCVSRLTAFRPETKGQTPEITVRLMPFYFAWGDASFVPTMVDSGKGTTSRRSSRLPLQPRHGVRSLRAPPCVRI